MSSSPSRSMSPIASARAPSMPNRWPESANVSRGTGAPLLPLPPLEPASSAPATAGPQPARRTARTDVSDARAFRMAPTLPDPFVEEHAPREHRVEEQEHDVEVTVAVDVDEPRALEAMVPEVDAHARAE